MNSSTRTCFTVVATLILVVGLSTVGLGVTTVEFAGFESGSGTPDNWNRLFARFMEQNPDIKVDVQIYSWTEFPEAMLTRIAAGMAPDLMQVITLDKDHWHEMGLFADLTERWEASEVLKDARFYPFTVAAAMNNGRYYGIPYDFNARAWFINLDLFEERGVNPPGDHWTVDDLKDMAQKLTDPDKQVYGTINPVQSGSLQWLYNWTGHEWLSEDKTRVLVNSPGHIDMLSYWNEMQNTLNVTPHPGSYPARADQYNGGYAMWEDYISRVHRLGDFAPFDWKITLMPQAPHAQLSSGGTNTFSIPAGSKQPDAAWRVAEWMLSHEGQRAIVEIMQRQPLGPYNDLWEIYFDTLGDKGPEIRHWLLESLYGMDFVRNQEYWPSYNDMSAIMNEHHRNIFQMGAPIANEIANAHRRLEALLEN